jgi:cytochrome b
MIHELFQTHLTGKPRSFSRFVPHPEQMVNKLVCVQTIFWGLFELNEKKQTPHNNMGGSIVYALRWSLVVILYRSRKKRH